MDEHTQALREPSEKQRIHLIDEIRGLVLISMIFFHAAYDVRYIFQEGFEWFSGPLQLYWQYSIGWTFVFIAGMATQFSRNSLKRFIQLALVALLISVVTYIASVDAMVKFGVIHLLASCALIYMLFGTMLKKFPALPGALLCFVLFLLTLPTQSGYLQVFFGVQPALPDILYNSPYLFWLGFPHPGYVDADYYPMIPYVFLYLSGMYTCLHFKQKGFPQVMKELHLPILAKIGTHTLPIYLLHQVVLIALLSVVFKVL
ncbi:MAG: heparan-alpha-glucosaminide N-acetyltransferase [Coriobacteriia bacterium]|nr:heparan-alpha-glucosaminide N-acetyltransferase [Coriobacteriia bacterium]